eukprot:14757488-Ditylum_brightwellii.AAC.1
MGTTVSGKCKILPKAMTAPMLAQRKAVQELHLLLPRKLLFNKKRGKPAVGCCFVMTATKVGKRAMEASMKAAYADQILCCCSVPFRQKPYTLS